MGAESISRLVVRRSAVFPIDRIRHNGSMYAQSILTATLAPMHPPTTPPQSLWEWGYDGVEVGIWECAPGTLSGQTGDYDEMMCMVAGRGTVTHADGEYDLAPGTTWVTPRNWSSTWTVHETTRKLYVIDNRPGRASPAAHLANAHTMALGAPVPRADAIKGEPHESSAELWVHNGLNVGVWEVTPGSFHASRDGFDEVFVCLSGSATMTGNDGVRYDLSAGSVLFTPAGFTGRWNVSETFRKVYCVITRA
jgi:uncharacterized protein